MSCSTIYDELEQYAQGRRGEPFVQGVCGRALVELHQLLDTIRLEHERVEGLLMENCGLRAQLMDANRMLEEDPERDRFSSRGYA